MYLESHKNLLRGLTLVGSHLGTHIEPDLKTQEFKEKLATINVRWNKIQENALAWKTELQSALTEVSSNFIMGWRNLYFNFYQ